MTTLIIGGGLSGLALAEALERQGAEYLLLEARHRFGGRIETLQHRGASYDLGPAWFWPGQPRMAALVARLGVQQFAQYSDGAAVFEDAHGQVQRLRGGASMQGALRLRGGLSALTQGLAGRIPDARKRLNAPVKSLTNEDTGVTATLASGERISATKVVLAMPPRVVATLQFGPALPDATARWMHSVPTWMAGQAKAVAIYDTPFWREKGLSADGSSRRGPLVEVHDASPREGGPFAIFGFIGVPPHARQDEAQLRTEIMAQLGRLFGPAAAEPAHLEIKDWAFDPLTATSQDQAPLFAHPTYGLPADMAHAWEGRVLFAGTEVAPQFGGYLEGALEAAENARIALSRQIAPL